MAETVVAQKQVNPLALTSIILGGVAIVGLVTILGPLAFFVAIAAIVTGAVANGQIREQPDTWSESSRGLALAGLWMGVGVLILAVLMLMFIMLFFGAFWQFAAGW